MTELLSVSFQSGGLPVSPVPSPPQPSSPSFGRGAAGGGESSSLALANESALLQQRLQRLQLIHPHPLPLHPHPPAPTLTPSPPLMPLPAHSPVSQRSDSPPGLTHLLHSRPSNLQRSSPPPTFQNLSAIREDSGDVADPHETDAEMVDEERVREDGPGPGQASVEASASARRASSGTPPSLDGRQRGFSGNPQISITDTQGHVTDVDTTPQEEARDTASPAGSPTGRQSDSPLGRPSGVPCSVAGAALAGGISSYPFSFLQGFGLINTNLASIPPAAANGDSSLVDLGAIYSWNKASPAVGGAGSAHGRASGHHAKSHAHTSPTHSHSHHHHHHQAFAHRQHPSHSSRFRRHNTFHDSRDMSIYNAWLANAAPLSDFSLFGRVAGGGGGGSLSSGRSEANAARHHTRFASVSSPSSPTYRTSPLSGSGTAPFSGFFSQPSSPLHQPAHGVSDARESLSSPPSPLNSYFPASTLDQPRLPAANPSSCSSTPSPSPSSHSDSNLFHSSPLGLFRPSSSSPSPSPTPSSYSPQPSSSSPPSPAATPSHSSPSRHSPFCADRGLGGQPSTEDGSMPRLLELAPAGPRTVEDVLVAIKDALDSVCPTVAYERLEKRFRLQQADLEMEVEVYDGEGEVPPGLHVRKLSGDHTHYAALCNHLLACVNN